MKKLVLVAFLLCGISPINAQFVFAPEGLTDFVVTEVPGKTKAEMYKSTLDWIQVTFKKADAVKAKTENETITFEGTGKFVSMDGAMKLTYDSRYEVQIIFKDGKYKFDILKLEYFTERNQVNPGGWRAIELSDVSAYFTKQGTLRPVYKHFTEIADHFNAVNSELKKFIESGASVPTKKSEW